MTEAALVCLHWMHARSRDEGHTSYRGWLPWHDTGPVFATGMLFVLLPLTHDALCSAPLPTFGFWLGPFCFHTANEPHQGSLGNEWRPPISSRPEFTCLVRPEFKSACLKQNPLHHSKREENVYFYVIPAFKSATPKTNTAAKKTREVI